MLAQRLKVFTKTMIIVCAILCVVIALVAASFASQPWLSGGCAIGAAVAMSVCTVLTTRKAARLSGKGLSVYWIFLDYLLKIVVLFVALSLTPERVFGGFVAIGSILVISLTQIICLFPRKKDPLLDSVVQD